MDRDACLLHDDAWYARARPRARHAHERDEARHRGAHRDALDQGGRRVRRRAARHGRERPPAARRRRAARRHPLPARARQRRRDPRRRGAGRARRARRRLLHRLRGRGDAHVARAPLHDGHARGRAALSPASARPRAASSPTLLRRKGVELVTGDGLERFEGEERVERVVTASGRAVDADLVVMGTGAMPGRDARPLRRPRARGDAAAWPARRPRDLGAPASGPRATCASTTPSCTAGRVRIEHFEVAEAQGEAAAAAMLGERRPFREVPYFWTDLADWATAEWVGLSERRRARDRARLARRRRVQRASTSRAAGSSARSRVGRGDDLAHARRLIAERHRRRGPRGRARARRPRGGCSGRPGGPALRDGRAHDA